MLRNVFSQLFRNRRHRRQAGIVGQNSPRTGADADEAVRLYNSGNAAGARAIAEDLVRNNPKLHKLWNLLGALAAASDNEELAVRHFEQAIALAPDNAEYLSNCGEAYRRRGRVDDALEHCRAAIAANPQHVAAHHNLALTLMVAGEVEQAYEAFQRALSIRPDFPPAREGLLFLLCHHPHIEPATILAEHRRWNELHARALAPQTAFDVGCADPGGKLRIGYVSADFRQHSVAHFIEPLLAHHDHERFEVFCYSNTRKVDEVTNRFRGYPVQWREITKLSDEAAAQIVREDRIDILVDLSGHTAGGRLLIFARKPAPVQVSYLGYLNTTGAQAIDFRITDHHADPRGISDGLHTERLLRMPHSQWCYRPPAYASDVNALPALQRGVVTYGSPHSMTKINASVIDLWSRVLIRQPRAELIIAGVPDETPARRLREQFAACGVDAARLHLFGKLSLKDYWQLYHRIDVGLDAFPYNGGTTTCESLWMGVPVVTLAGQYAAARSGASLLTSVGLSDLVADNPEQYVKIALDLTADLNRLAELRAGLRTRMKESPLMDEVPFTRAFEELLTCAFRAARPGAA